MKFRIFITALVLILLIFSGSIYRMIQGPVESEIAVNQLKDSVIDYAISREVARNELILKAVNIFWLMCLLILWGGPISQLLKGIKNEKQDNN